MKRHFCALLLLPCDVCDKLLPEGTKQEGGDQISNWTISGEWGNPPEAFGVFGVPVDEFEKLQDTLTMPGML